MGKINIAIVGLGYWGPNYARIVNDLDEAELTWCCDLSKEALDRFQRRYPQTRVTTNIKNLLTDPNLDAAIIVTPAQEHYKIAKKLLLNGKDILVEKPITANEKQAQNLINIAILKKRILMVDHTFLFNSAIRKLKEMLEEGKLGKVFYLYGLYNALGPIRRDVSAMWDLPHFIYVATYLLDNFPISVSATGKGFLDPKMEDVVFLNLEFPNNIIFNLHCSWIDPVKIRTMVVVGDKKMAVFDDMHPEEKLKIYDKGVDLQGDPNFANLQIILRSGDIIIPKIENKEPLKEVVINFLDSVKTRNRPFSDENDGFGLVKILAAAQKSLKNNGKRVFIK